MQKMAVGVKLLTFRAHLTQTASHTPLRTRIRHAPLYNLFNAGVGESLPSIEDHPLCCSRVAVPARRPAGSCTRTSGCRPHTQLTRKLPDSATLGAIS